MSILNSQTSKIILQKYNDSFIFRKSTVDTITDYWHEHKPFVQTHTTIYNTIRNYLSDNLILNKGESRTLQSTTNHTIHTFYNLYLDKNATILYKKDTKDKEQESLPPKPCIELIIYNNIIINKNAKIIIPYDTQVIIHCYGLLINRGMIIINKKHINVSDIEKK
eukprot:330916_1